MVTKEQCEQALRNLETINLDIVLDELGYEKAEQVSWYGMNDYPTLEKQGDIDVLRELIEEHFSNPPLKLEEIEVDMLVFDLKDSKYKKIESIYIDVNNNIATIGFDDYDEEIFEENRFYRKEVQE